MHHNCFIVESYYKVNWSINQNSEQTDEMLPFGENITPCNQIQNRDYMDFHKIVCITKANDNKLKKKGLRIAIIHEFHKKNNHKINQYHYT